MKLKKQSTYNNTIRLHNEINKEFVILKSLTSSLCYLCVIGENPVSNKTTLAYVLFMKQTKVLPTD